MSERITYILRLEGVNLGEVIDDTDQLSVRRGGGLMILNAALDLKESIDGSTGDRLTEIATGASIGLFEFMAVNEDDAEAIRMAVVHYLTNGHLEYETQKRKPEKLSLSYGTFVVDVTPIKDTKRPERAVQTATAMNRWRQLQQPSMPLNGIWDKGTEPCSMNYTRTSQSMVNLPGKTDPSPVCDSARDRRDYGRGARQRFYQHELGQSTELNITFTDDLQALSDGNGFGRITNGSDESNIEPCEINPNLADKIAVFYVDGNGFGKIGREIFEEEGIDGFRTWSSGLRQHHQKLLKGLLAMAEKDPLWKTGSDELRLETLLWGGDEILWVVPAWKGWEVAKWFFHQPHSVSGRNLTYGSGLVFCHAKAPIKNISKLAHRLGDLAKEARGDAHRLAYEILESFDDISGDLKEHRKRFLPPGGDADCLVVDATNLHDCWPVLNQIAACSEFPTRQLYRFTNTWRKLAAGNAGSPEETMDLSTIHKNELASSVKRMRKACTEEKIDIDEFLVAFGGDVAWLHLLQMLPYLPAAN